MSLDPYQLDPVIFCKFYLRLIVVGRGRTVNLTLRFITLTFVRVSEHACVYIYIYVYVCMYVNHITTEYMYLEQYITKC